jgi:hypothetical protein
MAKLYYGSANCSIESKGAKIRGVQIRYRGAIEIEDKTSDSFVITHQKNGILIFPIGEGTLNDLFDYVGEFKITSVIVADNNAEKVNTTIHRVMDYTELLNTKAEDMTTKSEDLSSTHVSGKKVAKTSLKQPNLNNQHTSEHNAELYLKDGTKYDGYYHIHLADNSAMTGKTHTGDSQGLYFNHGKPTKNPKLVPYGAIEQNKTRRAVRLKNRRSGKNRIIPNRRRY